MPGCTMFSRGLAHYQATDAKMGEGIWSALLADALARAGDPEAGFEALKTAIEDADGAAFWEAEYHRVEGDLNVRSQAADSTIEVSYQQALSVSGAQGSPVLELRAATGLARFWGERGKRTKAVELLLPSLEWVSEGFDTPDLKDAGVVGG